VNPIEIRKISKRFKETLAVDSLTLDVKKGECLGLLGPNGAGKTTTIKILTNLISPTSGKAFLMGIDVTEDPRKALSYVGAVVETPEFYPYLTPVEALAYLGRIRGMTPDHVKKRSNDVLREVGLTEWKDKKIGKFSKGMKQRLAIGQALLHEPEILILDEPASGLDPRGMVEVRNIILNLKNERKTIFMSSHMLHEVQEVCDRVALMDRGKLILDGGVEEVSRRFNRGRIEVQSLLPLTADIVDRIKKLRNVSGVEWVYTTHLIVDVNGGPEEFSTLLDDIRGLGVKITSFRQVSDGLEDMYMTLVRSSL